MGLLVQVVRRGQGQQDLGLLDTSPATLVPVAYSAVISPGLVDVQISPSSNSAAAAAAFKNI